MSRLLDLACAVVTASAPVVVAHALERAWPTQRPPETPAVDRDAKPENTSFAAYVFRVRTEEADRLEREAELDGLALRERSGL